MFWNCYNLNDIDISNINNKNNKNFDDTVYNCKNSNELDMINWDISNLKDIYHNPIDYLFAGTNKLKIIKISRNIKKKKLIKILKVEYF